jgi:hypothetical protein
MIVRIRPFGRILSLTKSLAVIAAALTAFTPQALRADGTELDKAIFETTTGVEFRATIIPGGVVMTSVTDPQDYYLLSDDCQAEHPQKGKGSWVWGPLHWDIMFPDRDDIGFHRQGPPYQASACYFEVEEPG